MFQQGDYIFYSCYGVCSVDEIREKDAAGEKKLYYILHPIHESNSRIMTPVNNEKVKMRSIMEPEMAEQVIAFLSNSESKAPQILDKKERNQVYTRMLKEGNPDELTEIIISLKMEENEKKADGKKISATDSKYLDKAERLLYTELATSLGIEMEQIMESISGVFHEIL